MIFGHIMSMLGFFRTPLGKIVSVLLLVIAMWIGFQWWLSKHDAYVRDLAFAEFNEVQRVESERLKKLYEDRLQAVLAEQEKLEKQYQVQSELLAERTNRLVGIIRSGTLQGGEASEVLRGTVRMLQEQIDGGSFND